MPGRKRVIDRRGRVWAIAKVGWEEAEEEDFRFWYERLTPEERVEAVADALADSLKTRGHNVVPRLRRVHRRIERPWSAISRDRRIRGRVPRPSARNKRAGVLNRDAKRGLRGGSDN